jgi:hypothetical protein
VLPADRGYDSCATAGFVDYFATASCIGQGLEQTFPYSPVDNNTCPASAERDSIKTALALRWALGLTLTWLTQSPRRRHRLFSIQAASPFLPIPVALLAAALKAAVYTTVSARRLQHCLNTNNMEYQCTHARAHEADQLKQIY